MSNDGRADGAVTDSETKRMLRTLDEQMCRMDAVSAKCLVILEERVNDPGVKRGEIESIFETIEKAKGFATRRRTELNVGRKHEPDDGDNQSDRVPDPALEQAARDLAAGAGPEAAG